MTDLAALKDHLHAATRAVNKRVPEKLPIDDQNDFEAARKGKIAQLPEGGVPAAGGRVAWNIGDFDFLGQECPDTVNPSLWRMAQLNAISGLFEVTNGVWQCRACDYANMTVIEGDSGWILVDPLMTRQTSAAALKMINETLGERPVSAILVTHTHPDHFGGLKGVTGDDPAHYPPIYAPEHFLNHAASEGILAGNQMARRAIYQFGLTLPTNETGVIDGGIGKHPAKGERTFVAPTHFISKTGEKRTIDGVKFVFQMASGTEAPAEFTFMLPDHKVLCMAEVCTQTMHNALPPRGAQVRDTLLWARTIDEAIELFADHVDILINCHNWPVWGRDGIESYLEEQRDIYKYIHDQTLRLANLGHSPNEIAEMIEEPDWLSDKFHARGYYGTLEFNARAVYQHYYGFYDGNPVNLNPLAPEQLGSKMVEAMGGAGSVVEIAITALQADDLQWAATLLSHVVFSNVEHPTAPSLLAETYRHLGYRQESGIMRNIYLMGAKELEEGVIPLPMLGGRNEDLAKTLPLQDWFDAYALRLNPERAKGINLVLNFSIDGEKLCVCVARQTEFARMNHHAEKADATVEIDLATLEVLVGQKVDENSSMVEKAVISGHSDALRNWLAMHDTFDLWFNLVTP